MKRVSVIGCPGAGKTTFARQLARATGLPLVHLDLMYHDQSYAYQVDKESWRLRVRDEAEKAQWIIDGNYKSTFDVRLPASDTIIFLDYPTHISLGRAIKRRLEYRNKVREDMPSTWKERLGWDFFMFIVRFNRRIRPLIRQQLQSYAAKDIVYLASPRDAQTYLDSLSNSLPQPWA